MWREMNFTILGVKVILHFAGLLLASLANIKLPAILISHVQSHGLNEETQDTNVSRSEGPQSIWERLHRFGRDLVMQRCPFADLPTWHSGCLTASAVWKRSHCHAVESHATLRSKEATDIRVSPSGITGASWTYEL